MSARAGAGRKPYQPTRVQRADVQGFKAEGWSNERIARVLGIAKGTLEKHFAVELAIGRDREQQALRRLLRRQANKGSVPAIRELLKRIDIGGAVDRFLEQPERLARQPKLGKKELALEEARRAHQDSDWGDDLAPAGETRH